MDMSWVSWEFFAILMLLVVLWSWKILHQQVNAIASIVTVIGVLGTFIGIAIGLYQFDTGNIEASVPALLEGLKIAFVSSIIGIFGSICLKLLSLRKRKRQAASEGTYTGATIDDLANILQEIYKIHQAEGNETRETLRAIEKALTGDGESTVLTQLQKLRTTFSDKQDDLLQAFKEFATQMADNNTKALIEALEAVMRDFNAKINEQFGDNFKQLNEAVGRINDWQEQYRQQMDELAVEFRIAAESIEKSRQSLESIAERSGVIVSSAEKLDPILQAIQQQIQLMNDRLEAFSALADNASNAFPIIENRLNQLTDNFTQVVAENIDNSQVSMERQREALTSQVQQLETMVTDTNRRLNTETERIFRESTANMTQQIQLLDRALQEELTKSIESLGSQLASLSRRFVDDYQPLTDQLRNVVRMADGLQQTGRYSRRQAELEM
ncbi:MAG: MotA/TolQ/ExbB proton channel family protein [Gemmatimonadota bacterium]|nr:MotA/TolQ/ExbB proton channel family protein [Gemmatimonadota bacterium]MDE2832737.1 MotA/TolQ/ExbB proton channel family protein [Gemmatimonadota bacterium]MDE2953383.1 MotA/TolQ/ExbB proton channel family protein [Gemmatimonadota bacterium]